MCHALRATSALRPHQPIITLQVVELEWGTREARDAMDLLGTFELVLAADCMYVDQVWTMALDTPHVAAAVEWGC